MCNGAGVGAHLDVHLDGAPFQLISEAYIDAMLAPHFPDVSTSCNRRAAPQPHVEQVEIDLLILILSSQQQEFNPAQRREAVRRSWALDTASANLGAANSSASQRCTVRRGLPGLHGVQRPAGPAALCQQ